MAPTVYIVTYHEFNHGKNRKPLDKRFLDSDKNYVYYLIDKEVPSQLQGKKVILERDLDPDLYAAGGKHFGEWSFLLAEEKHAFCEYPFFMISSRFYEKNAWLNTDLNREWETLFSQFEEYKWGYLPSYNRPIRWIDLDFRKEIQRAAWEYKFFPFTEKTYKLTEELFGVNIPSQYRFTADLFCNYIGFRSREDLLSYVRYYRPLIDYFFDDKYSLKKEMEPYIRRTGTFKNEKPFTFFLELLSHLYFFQDKQKYFALHYDGYYSVDESQKKLKKLKNFTIPLSQRLNRFFEWQWTKLTTEGSLSWFRNKLRKIKPLYKTVKFIKSFSSR